MKSPRALVQRGIVFGAKSGRLGNAFNTVPDLPIKRFTLTLVASKRGLLGNSTNLLLEGCQVRLKTDPLRPVES